MFIELETPSYSTTVNVAHIVQVRSNQGGAEVTLSTGGSLNVKGSYKDVAKRFADALLAAHR